jgi:WD40 repeat protein
MRISPNGKMAVTQEDITIRTWDLVSGNVLGSYSTDAQIESSTFATDRIVVAGDALGNVHFLSIEL